MSQVKDLSPIKKICPVCGTESEQCAYFTTDMKYQITHGQLTYNFFDICPNCQYMAIDLSDKTVKPNVITTLDTKKYKLLTEQPECFYEEMDKSHEFNAENQEKTFDEIITDDKNIIFRRFFGKYLLKYQRFNHTPIIEDIPIYDFNFYSCPFTKEYLNHSLTFMYSVYFIARINGWLRFAMVTPNKKDRKWANSNIRKLLRDYKKILKTFVIQIQSKKKPIEMTSEQFVIFQNSLLMNVDEIAICRNSTLSNIWSEMLTDYKKLILDNHIIEINGHRVI